MKRNYYLLILLVAGIMFASCKKDDTAYGNEFEKSAKSWNAFKSANKNSYVYMVSTSSWTGFSTETVMTVQNGIVTQRSYTAKSIRYPNSAVVQEQWTEDKNSLNTHTSGAAIRTLDDIYQQAKTDWLLERKETTTYFETKNNGLISTCGYTEKNCADDCFIGISIGFITACQKSE